MNVRSFGIAAGVLTLGLFLLVLVGSFLPTTVDPRPPGVSATMSDCSQLCAALWVYREDFGSYPQGTLKEIFDVLSGANPKGQIYLEAGAIDRNSDGVPIDSWGRPIEIRFEPEGKLSVISPGRDGVYKSGWFSDDILESTAPK